VRLSPDLGVRIGSGGDLFGTLVGADQWFTAEDRTRISLLVGWCVY